MTNPKVALVHDYLNQYGGAEKTLEAIAEVFTQAPIYTGIYNPKSISDQLNKREIITTSKAVNKLTSALPKIFTFLMPTIFEGFDLSAYDIIISDGTAWAKGVITRPSQLHISYIHTPPRFLYGYSIESAKRDKWYFKFVIPYLDHFLRIWDFSAAQRPDYLIANSTAVQERIRKFYKRSSTLINPPLESNVTAFKYTTQDNLEKPYYVALGRLSAYKNFDLLVNAFNILEIPLIIMGTGLEEKKLKKIARDNITFMGRVTEEQKHKVLHNALGYMFPVVEEDFGIAVLEAMLHGKPVLAHRSGGPLGTIRENVDGMFFDQVNIEHFVAKMKEFDKKVRDGFFDSSEISKHASSFNNKEQFKAKFKEFVEKAWQEKLTKS